MMLATYSSARADYGTNYTMQSILLVVLAVSARMVVKEKFPVLSQLSYF